MLKSLSIKNFAIIENTTLNFDNEFNVLIGETGAGKSIVLNAINFVLGAKANKDNIRKGTTEIQVKAHFLNINNNTKQVLNDFQIECEDDLIISRTYNADGKSSCFINGEVVVLNMLKSLGSALCDMFMQHDSVSVLNVKNHLSMLDSFDNEKTLPLKQEIENNLAKLHTLEKSLGEFGGNEQDRERLIDVLNFQIMEIENANLQQNEDDEIKETLNQMANFAKISEAVCYSIDAIKDSNLQKAVSMQNQISNLSESYASIYERLNNAVIELDDIEGELCEIKNNLSYSDFEVDKLNERLSFINSLKRKYGNSIEEIFEFLTNSKEQLEKLQNSSFEIEKLQKQIKQSKIELYGVCKQLSGIRKTNSVSIEEKINGELKTLGMQNAKFKIHFEELESLENCVFTSSGLDNVEFMISANKGEDFKSLAKTISGGELSRFMLAVKNVLYSNNDVDLLVFDEIDSGVSGDVGFLMGLKMHKLSLKYQILCITHLPQVTAFASNSVFIKKIIENNQTKSVANVLGEDQRVEYIASLFGSGASATAISHANELIEKIKQIKNKV